MRLSAEAGISPAKLEAEIAESTAANSLVPIHESSEVVASKERLVVASEAVIREEKSSADEANIETNNEVTDIFINNNEVADPKLATQ